MTDQQTMLTNMVLTAWNTQIERTDKLINDLTDEQLAAETSPGRNTGIYLLGHLTAAHDGMLPLLGLGEKLYPELFEPYLRTPDPKNYQESTADLRSKWNAVNEKLAEHFKTLQPSDWLAKHTSVSEEDFAKEPHRNRLNVLISRTNHAAGHHGQMIYLKR